MLVYEVYMYDNIAILKDLSTCYDHSEVISLMVSSKSIAHPTMPHAVLSSVPVDLVEKW